MSAPTITTHPELFDCVSFEALTEPVTPPCGHSMNLTTYRSVVASTSRGMCPSCRAPISAHPPAINIALRDIVLRLTGSGVAPAAASVAPASVAAPAMAATATPFKGVRLGVAAETIPCPDGSKLLHIQLRAPAAGEEEGGDYILGIDESGSMETFAWVAVEKGRMGITRLDLVKHMVRTMASMMTDRDRVAIVGFNDVARVRLLLTPMTGAGKATLDRVLDGIYANNSTNIYGAVDEMAKIANSAMCGGRRIVGVLLTDGQPTEDIPPVTGGRKTMPMIKERIIVRNPWQLHTIAFSSDANSALLEQLADWGKGRMLFVPSGDMVSTNGINLMAYEKSVASTGVTLTYNIGSVSYTMATGGIAFGATRDILIPMAADETVTDMLVPGADNVSIPTGETDRHLCRHAFVMLLTDMIDAAESALSSYRGVAGVAPDLERRLNAFHARFAPSTDPCVKAMLRDVTSKVDGEQQVRLALGFLGPGTWGMPYLRAYRDHMRAQICMNFKDPGLKIFETPRFLAHQAAGDTAFAAIPPPPVRREGFVDYSLSVATVFNNQGGSCFEGSLPVVMADGSTKAIRDIRKDDLVKGGFKVRYAVEFNAYAPSQPMVQLTPTVAVTPWHPCRRLGETGPWTFPANLVQYAARPLQTVYNLVLDKGHVIEADGYTFVTLGHGFQEVPLYHEFFGTERCIKTLEQQPGAADGRPIYKNCVAVKKDGIIVDWEDRTEDCSVQ